MTKRRILFLCTGNSARSQMAEGLLRSLAGDRFDVASAGTHPTGLNPLAVRAMHEIGIDISRHHSKSLDEFVQQSFDYVITVCDRAKESCPIFPGATTTFHWSFDDPAAVQGSEDARMEIFRRVQDTIQHRLRLFLATQQKR
jgi:arsenate reductase